MVLLLRSQGPAYRQIASSHGLSEQVEPDGILLHSFPVGETLAAIPYLRPAPPLPLSR